MIETRGGTILRTVVPIRNREQCYRCHDPNQKINGILILDYNAGEVRAAMTRDLRWMVAGTGALTFVIVGAIALVIRVSVLRRLQRFETTARLISQGDLGRRVPAEGSDTLAWMAQEFNAMADSVSGLVGEVRTQRERLETVINSIDDGIVVLDPERKIMAANDAFLQRAANSREQVLGCCCYELGPRPCNLSDCPTLACLRSGARQVRICERKTGNDTVAWEEIHASPILDASGRLIQVVEVWRDISERRAAEAKLAESHRLASVGVLASGFSHEMNTPLATTLMCVEGILRETPAGHDEPMDQARIRENATDRARTDPALPRYHPALPAPVARTAACRRYRRSRCGHRWRSEAGRSHSPRQFRGGRSAAIRNYPARPGRRGRTAKPSGQSSAQRNSSIEAGRQGRGCR